MESNAIVVGTLPDNATNFDKTLEGEYVLTRIWVRDGSGQAVRVVARSENDPTQGTPQDLVRKRGYYPVLSLLDHDLFPSLYNWTVRTHERVWEYWITPPDTSLSGVRSFVAAAEAGGLPNDWVEKAAEDADGVAHTVCSFTLTMDGARALGSEQEALTELASLPGDVHFFQRVAQIDGFTGVEKKSRQPDTLDTALYEPGDLFQTSHPDAASARGQQWTEQDVLHTTGLSLV